ncbi:hypothetical protein ACTFIU_006391 [Dictyostelium citrinum]
MVLIKEFRIPLPLTVEEYKVAQLFMVATISKKNTSLGEGIEVLENKPFADGATTGFFTRKIFHLGGRLPTWLRSFAPTSLQIEEKAWNAYPYCKTSYACPLLGDRFSVSIETRYEPDSGTQENCLNLNKEELSIREVEHIDIVNDPIDEAHYKPEEDPKIFQSVKTGRGKLQKDWMNSTKPIMCCYKVCKVEFRCWGVQNKVENFIQRVALRDTFFMGHRQIFCWIDQWFDMDMESLREFEKKTNEEMNAQFHAKNNDNNNNNNNNSNNNNNTQPQRYSFFSRSTDGNNK